MVRQISCRIHMHVVCISSAAGHLTFTRFLKRKVKNKLENGKAPDTHSPRCHMLSNHTLDVSQPKLLA